MHEVSPDNNQCKKCTSGMTLDSESKCKVCDRQVNVGRHWSGAGCITCVQNCLECTAADMCDKCVDGTYWDSTAKRCQSLY